MAGRFLVYGSWFNWPKARDTMTDAELENIPNDAQPPFWVLMKSGDNFNELTASCEATAALATASATRVFSYGGANVTYDAKKDWKPNNAAEGGNGKWAYATPGLSGSYPITASNPSDTGSFPPASASGFYVIRDTASPQNDVVYTTMAKQFNVYKALGKIQEKSVEEKFKDPAKTGATRIRGGNVQSVPNTQ